MMNKDQSPLRRILKACLKALSALIAFIVIFVIYADFKVKEAQRQVQAFSRLVVVGMPVSGLEAKATQMSLRFRRTAGSSDQSGGIQAWKGFAFGRWFCNVDYRDGKATDKRVYYID